MNPHLERRIEAVAADIEQLERDLGIPRSAKAAAILAGANRNATKAPRLDDNYDGTPFLETLRLARKGDPDANAAIKAVLGPPPRPDRRSSRTTSSAASSNGLPARTSIARS